MVNIADALAWYPINPTMSSPVVMEALLTRLQEVLTAGVPGDIVEMGCHKGTTSIFLQRMLDECGSTKRLHVYDSFKGLPGKSPQDNPDYGQPGSVKASIADVVVEFAARGLSQPLIHKGWFSDLPDSSFPEWVAFSFFDGDLYQSIMDSFARIYPRLSPGGIVCIHDYDVSNWPGTKAACDDFLADKPEKVESVCFLLGAMVKQ